jgi:hypothetical protein
MFIIFLTIAAGLFLTGIFSMNLSIRAKKIIIILVDLILIASFSLIAWYILRYAFYVSEVM